MTRPLLWSVLSSIRVPWAPSARSRLWSIVLMSALAAGCWSASPAQTVQPRDGRAGLQLAGTVDGRQLAVSDGAPRLIVGDCDPDVSGDQDVCMVADDIDGQLVVLAFENPDALDTGVSLPVEDPGCGQECDDVAEVAVVDLQLGTGARTRATDGRVTLERVEPFARYVGEIRLVLPSGRVSGAFDVVPRSD